MKAQDFLNSEYTYAVVGATDHPGKYGRIVFMDLCAAGLKVIPVNPRLTSLSGIDAVATLDKISPQPDVAVFVVPPEIGLMVMEDAAKLGIKKLWFQPGAESERIRQRGAELGLEVMADGSCIMVVRRQMGVGDHAETKHHCKAEDYLPKK